MAAEESQPAFFKSFFKWLRINLGIIGLLTGLVTGIMGTTWRISTASYQLDDVGKTTTNIRKELDGIHTDMIDVDRRLNEAAAKVAEGRRLRDGEMAALSQRVAVLEEQLRFLAYRTPTPPVGNHR